ncbi:MAG: branched-chain amino acid ABC transporter permease [Deltaproteobacteria bacterium]|jgi:branched-subunit amino acid ABC-type transport system permease component|nr:branched-chain amino acid ABC transporter permease [Deltaproteobacteria bacterium]
MLALSIGFGIITGGVLGLAALGLSLLFRTVKFINFAYGDVLALGAFLTFFFNFNLGLPLVPAALLGMASTGIVGVIIHKAVIKPLREGVKAGPLTLLIATMGAAFIIRNAILIIWGPEPKMYNVATQEAMKVGPFLITPLQLMAIGISVLIMVLIYLLLQYTKLGKMIRATSDNIDLARVRGIRTERVVVWTWFLSCALAGLAGVMLGLMGAVDNHMGIEMLLVIFASVIMGGIGNPYGAVAGAMIIGIAMEVSSAFGLSEYKSALAYLLMAVILLLKPKGLFAK